MCWVDLLEAEKQSEQCRDTAGGVYETQKDRNFSCRRGPSRATWLVFDSNWKGVVVKMSTTHTPVPSLWHCRSWSVFFPSAYISVLTPKKGAEEGSEVLRQRGRPQHYAPRFVDVGSTPSAPFRFLDWIKNWASDEVICQRKAQHVGESIESNESRNLGKTEERKWKESVKEGNGKTQNQRRHVLQPCRCFSMGFLPKFGHHSFLPLSFFIFIIPSCNFDVIWIFFLFYSDV